MEDMKGNTKRSIRNLIDLGLLFSISENQKWFFNAAKKVVANPRNPYNALVTRMIANVDNEKCWFQSGLQQPHIWRE
jgi:hypothetical protein